MSTFASSHGATPADAPPARATTRLDRFVGAIPLTSAYLWLTLVYAFEATKRLTPWLFTDELEFTQLSRSIAATGHAARRGQPHSFRSLYTIVMAPFWLIHNVGTAYAAIKYFDVLVMASVVFPTYLLARLVVGKVPALFAAVGAGAVPALAYSAWIVEETLAYPYAALCFYLMAKALIENRTTHRRRWGTAAVAAAIVAPAVRGELVVIPIVFLFAIGLTIWTSEWGRARRARWSLGDWAGTIALLLGAMVLVSGVGSHHYHQWYAVTQLYKDRIFILGDWAVGSFAIGVGVVPLVFGLAALVPTPGERRTLDMRVFRSVAVSGLFTFGLYTGMKAAYLSTVFATRVEERNFIYVAPLLFIGTAFLLERRRVNLLAFAAAAAYAFYLVVGTPFQMNVQLYSDALGLAILQQANRYFAWTPTTMQWLLLLLLAIGVAGMLALQLLRRQRTVAIALAAALALGMVAWNLTGEIGAAAGSNSIGRTLASTLRRPFSWVDDVTHGKPTFYLAQGQLDQDPEWELEFWNRSLTTIGSLDGTLGGPGPTSSPNITTTGQIYWTADPAHPGPIYSYAVEDWPCIDFAGTLRATHLYNGGSAVLKQWRLVQLTRPNRLRAVCSGIYPDGWTGPNDSTYFRFKSSRPGWLRIVLLRGGWPATPVTVQIGDLVQVERVATLGTVKRTVRFELSSDRTQTIWLRVPGTPFAARTVIEHKFEPHLLEPSSGDVRTLGAHVSYRYFTNRPAAKR